ncbi:MAG TPA: Hsp20/alpha crystallin family protein [Kofleriaceae bacterium]|jgi:HSP20 family protein|nr:Hsp20/alpha crystallin family protein [Kofleriaceae bacterium]
MLLSPWNDWERDYYGRGYSSLAQLRRQMDEFVRELERPFSGGTGADMGWPATNLYDNGSELLLCAAVPGLSEKDIEINAAGTTLTISGKRTMEVPKGYQVLRQERGDIQFARSFSLPTKVDFDKCSATVKDGMLILKMSKTAEAQPRRISVRSQG